MKCGDWVQCGNNKDKKERKDKRKDKPILKRFKSRFNDFKK